MEIWGVESVVKHNLPYNLYTMALRNDIAEVQSILSYSLVLSYILTMLPFFTNKYKHTRKGLARCRLLTVSYRVNFGVVSLTVPNSIFTMATGSSKSFIGMFP